MREWFRRLAAEMARRNETRFFEEIESAFRGLVDRGFEITDRRYSASSIRSQLGRPLPENAPYRPVRWLGRIVGEDLDEIVDLLQPDRAPEPAEALSRTYDEWFTARFVTPYRRDG